MRAVLGPGASRGTYVMQFSGDFRYICGGSISMARPGPWSERQPLVRPPGTPNQHTSLEALYEPVC